MTFARSKLPDVGTTIFTVMSRRARELGALRSVLLISVTPPKYSYART